MKDFQNCNRSVFKLSIIVSQSDLLFGETAVVNFHLKMQCSQHRVLNSIQIKFQPVLNTTREVFMFLI